jgi:NAD/NADP octopine/nopaline dehydrogenase, alpha-helical domain
VLLPKPEAMKRRACILGAGNSAHVTAGLIASLPDWECVVYASRNNEAELWQAGLERGGIVVAYGPDDDNLVVTGKPIKVSKKAEDVVPGCELLIMCLPAVAFDENVEAAAPYVEEGAAIGVICGTNGVDWCIDAAMQGVGRAPDTYAIFALQNLPWACRIDDYGYKVSVLGAKPFMEFVARPQDRLQELSEMMAQLIRVECRPLPCGFLGVGLSNLCQVIHPVVMHDNFKDWDGRTPFQEKPLFYQGLSEEAADRMYRLSDEIIDLRHRLEKTYPSLDLSIVYHIFEWCERAYGKYITDDSTLQKRFSTNKAYAGLTCPMLDADRGGYLPDFQARYLSEDIPYNLVAVKGLADLMGVETPTIDLLVEWSQDVLGKEYVVGGRVAGKDLQQSFAPQRFGFEQLEDIPEVAAAKVKALH